MATKVIMPKQGLQMTEGTIISWLAAEGEEVKEGQPLFEMETDKLTIEINTPASGTLLKILHGEGDVVPITKTIAFIGESGEDISTLLSEVEGDAAEAPADQAKEEQAGEEKAQEEAGVRERSERYKEERPAAASAGTQPPGGTGEGKGDGEARSGGPFYSSPRARWKAEEHGIDIRSLRASGPEGMVVERDVLSALERGAGEGREAKATPLAKRQAQQSGTALAGIEGTGPRGKVYRRDVAAAEVSADASEDAGENVQEGKRERRAVHPGGIREDRLVPLTGMRRTISARMRESLDTAAQAVHRIEVDMSETVRMRGRLKEADIKVSYNDIVVKAVADALCEHPRMNSRLTDEGILELGSINIGIAVALEEGLIVPVIRNADFLGLEDIREETLRLADLARTGELGVEDYEGGSFSVSNLGMYDLDSFTAIINRPESGILAVGAIKEKPAAIGGELAVRPMCELSLTYDHRVIDGAPAAAFLRHVKRVLENPYMLV